MAFAVISERWTEDIQVLLLRLGIYSRRLRKAEPRLDRSDLFEVQISQRSERAAFRSKVGFLSAGKAAKLDASLELDGKACPSLREEEIVAIEDRGVQPVFDIQTDSGEYLSNNIRVHNCFILSVEDTMPSILNWYVEEGMIFKGGSGSGINLSTIRSSREQLGNGGEASGPVSFMRGADASAGTIKSGGKTRRAAKMVVLNVDHPDVRDFIWCKAREAQGAGAARRRVRHGPGRPRLHQHPVPERQQLGPGHRQLHAGLRGRHQLRPQGRARRPDDGDGPGPRPDA